MTLAEPTGGQRFELIERTIARVRVGAVAGAYALIAFGGNDARSYRAAALVIISLGAVYTAAMVTRRFRLRTELSSALDLGFTIAIITTTGAGRSIAVGYLFLVLGASALRFSPIVSTVIAIIGSSATAIVILATPRPDLATALRVELALGWAGSLLLASILVGLLSDLEIQEREELLVQRERATSLGQQDAARRRTLRMVAHDLTAPLVAVEGIARTLQDSSVDLGHDDTQEALAILAEHAGHLRSFASSLRDVANAGDVTKLRQPQAVPLDLHAFLDSVCRAQTLEPSHPVEFHAPNPLPTISTDPDKLRRVMINLIDNAIRHSPANEPVVVEAVSNQATMLVSVIDNGPGVDQADLERIFRAEWQGSGEVGESGLGLWIVAELVNDLDGSVRATTTERGGLAVVVELPR